MNHVETVAWINTVVLKFVCVPWIKFVLIQLFLLLAKPLDVSLTHSVSFFLSEFSYFGDVVTEERTSARKQVHTHTHTHTHARPHVRTHARAHTHTQLPLLALHSIFYLLSSNLEHCNQNTFLLSLYNFVISWKILFCNFRVTKEIYVLGHYWYYFEHL